MIPIYFLLLVYSMSDILTLVLIPSLIASLGWGLSPIFDKYALKYFNNEYVLVNSLKILFGGIIGVIFLLFIYQKKNLKEDINNKNYQIGSIFVLLSTIFSFALGYLFYYKALSNSNNTTLVALITYVLPIFIIALLSYFILGEKFNFGMVCGFILSVVGICIFIHYSQK